VKAKAENAAGERKRGERPEREEEEEEEEEGDDPGMLKEGSEHPWGESLQL